jgi:hypothetical protein
MRLFRSWILACALAAGVACLESAALAVDCPTGNCPLSPQQLPPSGAGDVAVDARPIARIENSLGSGRSFGSGTLVDVAGEQGLVVTCAHLFREGTGTIVVTFPGGTGFGGRVAKLDAAADLAAVFIAAPALQPVELAAEYPQRGDPLVSCGYGSDGRLWCNHGQTLGYVTTLGSHGCETLELSGTARLGDSGGPVFDRHGRLAAVLFGTNGRVVDATYCGRVRQFLEGLSPRFQNPAQPPAPPAGTPSQLDRIPPRILRPGRAQGKNTPAQNTPAQNSGPLDQAVDALGAAAQPWLSAKIATLLIAVGVPGGIAGLAGGAVVWLVMRRGKKRMHAEVERLRGRIGGRKSDDSATTTSSNTSASTVEAVEAPPEKIVERHHNRYVPYEASTVDKAWAGAHARVSEKYPGAVPYLKIVEGVKDQLLSGADEPQVY